MRQHGNRATEGKPTEMDTSDVERIQEFHDIPAKAIKRI